MSFPNRALSSHIRHPSTSAGHVTAGHSSALLARINEKKIELENLKELRDLSAGLAAQMQTLEEKLATLSDGTEAVATVLSNWHNVLRAINMASQKISIPKDEQPSGAYDPNADVPLPQTLVRIPTQQTEMLPQEPSGTTTG